MTTITEASSTRKRLPLRVWDLLRQPSREWSVIAEETGGVRSLYFRFVLPLVLIGPICTWLGGALFGIKMGALVFPPDPVSAGFGAAATVVLHLLGVYAVAMMVDVLAPSFGGEQNRARAFKLAAYASTPIWVTGVFALYPPLWLLGVFGLYAIYLVYAGLPVMMRTRKSRPWLYALLISGLALVLVMVASLIPATIVRINLVPKPGTESRWEHRQFQFPGMDDRQRIARKLAESVPKTRTPSAAELARPPVTGDELQTLLPAQLMGGFTRASVENSHQTLGPSGLAQARAVFTATKSSITLQVEDLGPAAAADKTKPHGDQETARSYAKVSLVDGRLTSEAYDRDAHSGSFAVVVAGRFAVKASGDHVVIGDLQNAVKAVDFERLEAMAKG